jgi:hydroxymethylpyrimidine pyrophosphatase-like HAD family hydrolase
MNSYFRAIAIDFDGTLTAHGTPSESVLAAIDRVRAAGLKTILATGRILTELRDVFPMAERYFDAIVSENGAALSLEGALHILSPPVESELDDALIRRGVPYRRGQVLLATHTGFEDRIQDEIHRLGLECRLVYNRGELMILPPGVSKGFGLLKALEELGISYHNTIAVGDAENDHSLLGACEFGAAVANAVDGLKRHADLVLEHADGEGVAALLDRLARGDDRSLIPARWRIAIGTGADGSSAEIAASRVNLLITGRSKSGKSFATGTIAERLIELGYSVCLIDPEGDYASLGKLHGVECLGRAGDPPDVEVVRRFLAHRFGSVIVDLSLMEVAQ